MKGLIQAWLTEHGQQSVAQLSQLKHANAVCLEQVAGKEALVFVLLSFIWVARPCIFLVILCVVQHLH